MELATLERWMDSLTVFCNYFTHLCGHFLIESKVGLELLCKTGADQIDLFLALLNRGMNR